MVTCLKINTVMGGFKLLESHNRSVSDLYFTIFAGYKTDHRAVLAFTDQCTSGGTGPYRSALVRIY